MSGYNIYAFHLRPSHIYIRNLLTDPANFLEANITAYVTAYGNIQERKDVDEYLVVKIPPPHVKNNKLPQFANMYGTG